MSNLAKVRSIVKSPALRAVFKWSRPVHRQILLLSILGVVTSLLSLAVPLVTRGLIDSATSPEQRIETLWLYGSLLVAVVGAARLLTVLTSRIRINTSVRLQMEMQRMVTDSLMIKDYASIKPYHSGDLVNRIFSDVGVVKGGVISLLPSILQTAVSFVGAAIILLMMDWRFLPLLLLAGAVGLVISILFRNPMKRRHKRMQEAEGALHASTQENLENIRTVKASMSEERALRQMEAYRENLADEQMRNGRLSIWMNQGMGVLFEASWLICYLWGCARIFHHEFTYGSLAALIQLVGRIQGPISSAVGLVSQAYGVVSSAERLMEVVDLPDDVEGIALSSFDEIRLEHVSFQYRDGTEDVLLDVNATIRSGDSVALTGQSGGGKTSLFQLLLAIYRPTSGRVLFVSGDTVCTASRSTRGLFAYVPQGNTLFSGTLRDNLTMFADSVTEERLQSAIEAACLEDLVREIGLDARLGERGLGLSEGQAQRVAVARALLSDAPILLLDEATAALDERTEVRMLRNIAALPGKTLIIVTHRRAALAICGKRFHIADGHMTPVDVLTDTDI